MSIVSYKSSSPYVLTQQTSWYLGIFVRRSISPHISDDYKQIDVKYHLRPDLMAYDLYGDVDYAWVFLARNIDIIRDYIFDFTAGTWIYLPQKNRIKGD